MRPPTWLIDHGPEDCEDQARAGIIRDIERLHQQQKGKPGDSKTAAAKPAAVKIIKGKGGELQDHIQPSAPRVKAARKSNEGKDTDCKGLEKTSATPSAARKTSKSMKLEHPASHAQDSEAQKKQEREAAVMQSLQAVVELAMPPSLEPPAAVVPAEAPSGEGPGYSQDGGAPGAVTPRVVSVCVQRPDSRRLLKTGAIDIRGAGLVAQRRAGAGSNSQVRCGVQPRVPSRASQKGGLQARLFFWGLPEFLGSFCEGRAGEAAEGKGATEPDNLDAAREIREGLQKDGLVRGAQNQLHN